MKTGSGVTKLSMELSHMPPCKVSLTHKHTHTNTHTIPKNLANLENFSITLPVWRARRTIQTIQSNDEPALDAFVVFLRHPAHWPIPMTFFKFVHTSACHAPWWGKSISSQSELYLEVELIEKGHLKWKWNLDDVNHGRVWLDGETRREPSDWLQICWSWWRPPVQCELDILSLFTRWQAIDCERDNR